MQISRMFEMLYILLSRERVTAAELAGQLEVSVRTVYRDAQALCEAGVPLYAERGRDGGLSILPTYKLNKAVLSDEDRRCVLSSLTALAQTGASDAATLRKLTSFFGSPAPDWVQIDMADWSGRQDLLLATLKTAILERRLLGFDYYGESGRASARRVCPTKLWFKGHAWYLRAYCLDRHAIRTFKLTRIKRAQILPGAFPPEALTAQADDIPSSDWEEPPMCPVVLRVDECMAFRLWDDFNEDEITRLDGGGFLVRAAFPPGEWILSLVLSYGAHAQVVAPDELRTAVKETLQRMLPRYKD